MAGKETMSSRASASGKDDRPPKDVESAAGEIPEEEDDSDDLPEEVSDAELEQQPKMLRARHKALRTHVLRFYDAARKDIERLKADNETLWSELNLVKRALSAGQRAGREASPAKVRVPEPKAFDGARDAKELENFLWDIEEYFKAVKVHETEKVMIATMYLSGDAKLWWRARVSDDVGSGRGCIESWEGLKRELKAQFLPSNASWLARENLRCLKHTGTLRDYVKEYTSLMLDIHHMSDEDKLFNFVSGLQPWAQAELRRQGVKDLPSAIASAEGLVDFQGSAPHGKNGGRNRRQPGNDKFGPRGKNVSVEAGTGAETGESRERTKRECWTCGGDHLRRNCPKHQNLNAMKDAVKEDEPSDDGSAMMRVGALQLV